MSVLRDVQRLLNVIEGQYPRSKHSALFRTAAKRALRSAALAETEWQEGDTIEGAREGSLEDEECQDPGSQTTDLNSTLTRLLGKPPLDTLQGSTESHPPKNVLPMRSTPSRRT